MKLTRLPNLKFASADIDAIDLEIVSAVETYLGRKLARADPLRLFLRGVEQIIQQQRLLIDQCAKQNLLAYAVGDNLEHLGALVGVERMPASAATVTMKLTLSAPRAQATVIPAGIRFTAGDNRFFALDNDCVFDAGTVDATVHATCTELGVVGNDYLPGEIDTISDPKPFLDAAVNITKSEGGADVEGDESLRERIHEAPESFSVAGPFGAYHWFAMSASALISDVSVTSPEPGVVQIRPLLKDGVIPTEEILEAVYAACNDRSVRPLTDKVEVLPPDIVTYKLVAEYYIATSQATSALAIDAAAQQAAKDFVLWQRSALGRDINPTEFIHRLHEVGVKRVNLIYPEFRALKATEVAVIEEEMQRTWFEVIFAGLEED